MVKTSQPRKSVWTDITTDKKVSKEGIIRELPQVPGTRKSVRADLARKARVPGLRLSKNGNKYWESRMNRSDVRGTKL